VEGSFDDADLFGEDLAEPEPEPESSPTEEATDGTR